jgi:membrane-bound ClpP family serine protease
MTLIITLLILTGLALVVVEVVFIPGTTVVGIIGVLLAFVGIILGYTSFGSTIGFYILSGTVAALGILLYLSFRNGAWDTFALKNTIDSKNNEGYLESFKAGDEGVCLSALRPMGKAEFNNRVVEVSSQGDYVDAGRRIRIKEVSTAGIIVEQIA